jgi:ABC-type nitrate/sulfonate/bicarbonate transport system substrate-binding protein
MPAACARALAAVGLLAVACGPIGAPSSVPTSPATRQESSQPASLASVRIAVASGGVSVLPFYVALEQGFFRAHGVDAALQMISSSSAQAALLNNEIQFLSSPSDAVTGAAGGLPLKIAYSAWDRAPWVVVGKPELRSPTDVRGKTVGTNRPGTGPHSYLEAGLRQVGLSATEVNLLYLSATQDDYAALLAGQVDATVLSPPFDAQPPASSCGCTWNILAPASTQATTSCTRSASDIGTEG